MAKKCKLKSFLYNLRIVIYIPATERFHPGRIQTQLTQLTPTCTSCSNHCKNQSPSGKQHLTAGRVPAGVAAVLRGAAPASPALTHPTRVALAGSDVHHPCFFAVTQSQQRHPSLVWRAECRRLCGTSAAIQCTDPPFFLVAIMPLHKAPQSTNCWWCQGGIYCSKSEQKEH